MLTISTQNHSTNLEEDLIFRNLGNPNSFKLFYYL